MNKSMKFISAIVLALSLVVGGLVSPSAANAQHPEPGYSPASGPVVIAVLDTGCESYQDEIRPWLFHNPREIEGDGKDNDNNGAVDDMIGWNFLDGNPDTTNDPSEHGTCEVSMIVRELAKIQTVLGRPINVKVLPVKFLLTAKPEDTPNGEELLWKALVYLESFPEVKVVNLAVGGMTFSGRVEKQQMRLYRNNGAVCVVAAGNRNKSLDSNQNREAEYPAASGYRAPQIVVAACDSTGKRYEGAQPGAGSNYGSMVRTIANGVNVETIHGTRTGTSAAVPKVSAGSGALFATRFDRAWYVIQYVTIAGINKGFYENTGQLIPGGGMYNTEAMFMENQIVSLNQAPEVVIDVAKPGKIVGTTNQKNDELFVAGILDATLRIKGNGTFKGGPGEKDAIVVSPSSGAVAGKD
jgi:hypothetical protein